MTKPDWCTQDAWDRALKLADVWQHPMHHDYQIFAEDAARALMEAERRNQQEIDRLRREIDHKQKAMSSQAAQWTRSMAEAERRGMEKAAKVAQSEYEEAYYAADDGMSFSVGETIADAVRAKAQEVSS